MYIADVSRMLDIRSMVTTAPLDGSRFTLDTSGVAGVFGGDEAVSAMAMATIHVYEHRRWLGWYNSPGSYTIARRYGLLAKSHLFDGLFPGVRTNPATLFGFDGWKGPKFWAAHSGTIIEETSHPAALFMMRCASLRGKEVEGRTTQSVGVTIAKLTHVPDLKMVPKRISAYSPVLASIPISVSVGTCVACAVFSDWFSFLTILLGIFSGGISCLVIGSGTLTFTHPRPGDGCPPGDGILSSDDEVVLLRGEEGAVNSITRGRFSLNFASEPEYRDIGWSSVLLTFQFVAQLLLIPQGSLFGQLMFVSSLAVSWAYNSWLSSLDKEKIQREILVNNVLQTPKLTKYILGTRTSMVVFVLLVLQPEDPSRILDELLPNDTKVWTKWKSTITDLLRNKETFDFGVTDWDLHGFTIQEKTLLETLFKDAQSAYDGFMRYSP
ncbi:hypothetical protein BU15DRAFT_80831 [Melanogaster broomeanus]|nr:hypothetical protein BU15DRAFT_80831 [Melanogaster broomeanus]